MSSNTISAKVEGLKQLDDNLRALSAEVAAKWVNGGLRAGVRTIQDAAKGSTAFTDRSGTLRGTIRVRRGKKVSSDNRREYFVMAGSRIKGGGGAFYAHMVERGTKPHLIRGHLRIGNAVRDQVRHPGAKPTHFLEWAARRTATAAVDAMARYIRAKLDRAGLLNPTSETE